MRFTSDCPFVIPFPRAFESTERCSMHGLLIARASPRRRLLRSIGSGVIIAFVLPVVFLNVARCQSVAALYNFGSQNGSAAPQDVALVQGRDGRLYGTSEGNGTTSYGSIFKVSTSRVFTELFDFNNSNFSQDGCCPGQGLTLASDGKFYGSCGWCRNGSSWCVLQHNSERHVHGNSRFHRWL